jgi:hypothetical protein
MELPNDILLGTKRFLPKEDCGYDNLPIVAEGAWKLNTSLAFARIERHQFCNPTSK